MKNGYSGEKKAEYELKRAIDMAHETARAVAATVRDSVVLTPEQRADLLRRAGFLETRAEEAELL